MMETTGTFFLGVLFTVACHAFYYLRKNPLQLPERDGFVVVTRKDGSQHYRRLCTAVERARDTAEPAV